MLNRRKQDKHTACNSLNDVSSANIIFYKSSKRKRCTVNTVNNDASRVALFTPENTKRTNLQKETQELLSDTSDSPPFRSASSYEYMVNRLRPKLHHARCSLLYHFCMTNLFQSMLTNEILNKDSRMLNILSLAFFLTLAQDHSPLIHLALPGLKKQCSKDWSLKCTVHIIVILKRTKRTGSLHRTSYNVSLFVQKFLARGCT